MMHCAVHLICINNFQRHGSSLEIKVFRGMRAETGGNRAFPRLGGFA